MKDFTIRGDSVDVEQIMRQIRARIRDKRGVDYTEQEIRELASAKLEKFLDPQKVRSELLREFQRVQQPPPPAPNYAFEDTTLFESHRAPVRWLRRLLQPILKLFFNPNPLIQALHIQSQLNVRQAEEVARRAELTALTYEVIHNLVLELTRTSIEVKNLRMRVESLSSRLDFDERRARALEGVVQYRPDAAAAPAAADADEPEAADDEPEGAGTAARPRRRRRRRRKPSRGAAAPDAAAADQQDAAEPRDEAGPADWRRDGAPEDAGGEPAAPAHADGPDAADTASPPPPEAPAGGEPDRDR